jgi:hypothetical protein
MLILSLEYINEKTNLKQHTVMTCAAVVEYGKHYSIILVRLLDLHGSEKLTLRGLL